MSFKSHRQPFCRGCGKPIPKRTGSIYFGSPADQNVLGGMYIRSIVRPASLDEARKTTNSKIVHHRWDRDKSYISKVSTWDGETYEDEFFCTNRCAESYARMMARAGDNGRHNIQSAAYADSLRKQAGMNPR